MMILRFSFLLILLTVLAGCATPSGDFPRKAAVSADPYVSRVESSEAKALYFFAEADLMATDGDFEGAAEALSRALESDPHSAFLRVALAKIYLHLNEEKKAVRTAEDALIQDPSFWEAQLLLGSIYFDRGENDEAAAHFRQALELNPELESAYLHLGIALARAGEMDQAVDAIKSLLQRNPDSLVAELALARLYREIDLTVLAEESYRRILSSRPDFEPAYIELGEMYQTKGMEEKALQLYRQALVDNPGNARIGHQMVRILIGQDRLEEALRELEAILGHNPQDMDARRKIGLIHMEQENWTAAVEVFTTLLKNHPEQHPELLKVRFYLGTALERREDFSAALEVFQKIPTDSELYGDALSHVSYLLYRLGRTEEAISLLEERLGEIVARPELYIYLSSLYLARDQHEAALSVLNKGIAAYPDNAELTYQKGLVLEGMGESARASATMKQTLRLDPDHVEALNFLAYSYAESGQNLEEALRMAQRALELRNQGHIMDTLGWVYFKLGRFAEARDALEKAVGMLPADPVVLEHLGDALRALHQDRQARAAYEQVLEMVPHSETVRHKIDALAEGE
jgi:tetratricopeptide (TPR) repeat protein